MIHRIKQILLMIALLYLFYLLIAGIFSYLWPTPVSKQEKDNFQVSDLLGKEGETGVDRAVLVESPKDAFSRRIEIIRSATKELDICCHCVKSGESVDCIFGEVIKAADRGVKVRVLMDGKVSGMVGSHKDIPLALLSHPNIEYKLYNPVNLLTPWKWNVLLHDKFIIADDRMFMLGGRNMGDEYFNPPGYDGKVTYDRDALIINTASGSVKSDESVIPEAKAYMDSLWELSDSVSPSFSEKKRSTGEKEQERLRTVSDTFQKEYPGYYFPEQDAFSASVQTRKVSLLSNPIHTFKKEPLIGYKLKELLLTGEDIQIQTPYSTAHPLTLKAFRQISQQADSFTLLTNSLASSPNYPAFSAYLSNRGRFVATGVSIYEYQSTDSIHGKSMLMDSHISVVGSLNLDDRSLYIDTESVLVIDSPAFNQLLRTKFDALQSQSAKVGEDNRYVQGSVPILPVPAYKKVIMGLVSIFSNLFRFLI